MAKLENRGMNQEFDASTVVNFPTVQKHKSKRILKGMTICRCNEQCMDKMKTDAGSLLTSG